MIVMTGLRNEEKEGEMKRKKLVYMWKKEMILD